MNRTRHRLGQVDMAAHPFRQEYDGCLSDADTAGNVLKAKKTLDRNREVRYILDMISFVFYGLGTKKREF